MRRLLSIHYLARHHPTILTWMQNTPVDGAIEDNAAQFKAIERFLLRERFVRAPWNFYFDGAGNVVVSQPE